ncbi:formate dehydrogenase subunit delta [Bosea sp. CS1GBMeth4]|uniref:formate dehydrogenase subunit delta n=1 Tax=Bosea sp. CS1GBMeth4 TaxID=1892849 RepID=UPI001646C340|nr:formate dehydrogenase subunit delta [Bosea sp. CS1GBMeth4]
MTQAEGERGRVQDHAGEHLAKLAHMANQIGDFFKSYPEAEAVAAIANHINQFWTKRMREEFRTGFEKDASALSPLVRKARAKIRPASSG